MKAMKEAPVSRPHSPFSTAVQSSAHNRGSKLMAGVQRSRMRLIGPEVSSLKGGLKVLSSDVQDSMDLKGENSHELPMFLT